MKTNLVRAWSQKSKLGVIAATFVLALACVTVNVNFPESAVQKATDDYVKDLYRAKEKGKTPTTAPQSLLDLLIPSAQAEEINFRIETEKTKAIKVRQGDRLSELVKLATGQWGENSEGFLETRFADDFKKKEILVKKVESLIAAENADRKALYDEVYNANEFKTETHKKLIQQKFANSFREAAPAGVWVQGDDKNWKKK